MDRPITIRGVTHQWRLTARRMLQLGIKGFGDGENWGRVAVEALSDFDALVRLIHAGAPQVAAEDIRETIMDWTSDDCRVFLGIEDTANPQTATASASGSTGAEPAPSPGTISA